MCSAETAKSAAAIVRMTRDTPLRDEPQVQGEPGNDLAFLKARKVGELLTALMDDEQSHRLADVLVTLDFFSGGGHVALSAASVDPAGSGFAWRVEMEFIHTWKLGKSLPIRHRDTEEPPIIAKRQTINRISRGVFEDINSVLSARVEK
jgi:hypothetical protein